MRQYHRKTRVGCSECKRRKIKCDEKKPSCYNCDRTQLKCSFTFLTPTSFLSKSQTIVKARRPGLELSPSSFDLLTQELLFHYSTKFHACLADNRSPLVWRVAMPRLGLAYPFLLSGILSTSALHLALLQPHRKRELERFAMDEESTALPVFQSSLKQPNNENIHAVIGFAGSLVYYIMASPETLANGDRVDKARIPSRHDSNPHWFQTMRGLMVLLQRHYQVVSKGPFGPLFEDIGELVNIANLDGKQFCGLAEMLSSPMPDPTSPHVLLEDDNTAIYLDTLTQLNKVSALSRSPSRDMKVKSSIHMWAGNVSQDFVELVYDRDPRALVLLAHYCVLLKMNDHVWCLRGLGTGMLENIKKALPTEWWPWIQWALDQATL